MGKEEKTTLSAELNEQLKEELKDMLKSEIQEIAGEVLWDLMERVQKLEDWKLDIKHGWVKVDE